MKLIVGLGNPGKKYENTRHNIGFMVIDSLKKELGILGENSKFQGLISEKNINGEKFLFLKPQTFMNLSGNSIVEAVNFYKLDIKKDVFIIYDDMDLELGRLRVKEKGSAGGHNGMKSIISYLGSEFIRIRCGIGGAKYNVIDHVIGAFDKDEQELVNEMIKKCVECLLDVINLDKIEKIMQKYNTK